jgi:hypothetical protein
MRAPLCEGATAPGGTSSERAAGLFVLQSRESGFASSLRGARFAITHQTPGTLVTCQTSFVATTPSFMLRVDSFSVRVIMRSLSVHLDNTPGGNVYVCVGIDTTDRYSSGGTAWTAQNMNEESATSPVFKFYDTPTLSAAGAGTRYIATAIMPAVPCSSLSMDFKDGLLLGFSAASLMVYVWAATTAPQVIFNGECEAVK